MDIVMTEHLQQIESQLHKDLSRVNESLAELPDDSVWQRLESRANRSLASARASLARHLHWRVSGAVSGGGIINSISRRKISKNMADFAQKEVLTKMNLVLMMYGGDRGGKNSVYRFPSYRGWVLQQLDKAAKIYGRPILALDYGQDYGRFRLCVSHQYEEAVFECNEGLFLNWPGEKAVNLTPFIQEGLEAAALRFEELITEYATLAVMEARRHRLEVQKSGIQCQIQAILDVRREWARVHLPANQLVEIHQQLQMLLGPNQQASGLLLTGGPGVGKTFLSSAISRGGACKFIKTGVNDLKKEHLGGGAQAVKRLWEEARRSKPCVLFVDECDSIFPQRGSAHADVVATEITNAFLSEWSGQEKGIWVIGATNRRELLDGAVMSRFGMELTIEQPDAPARERILAQELKNLGFSRVVPPGVAGATQGMSGRDLSMVAQKIATFGEAFDGSAESFITAIRKFRGQANVAVDENATWDSLIVSASTMGMLKTTCEMLRNAESWRQQGVAIASGLLMVGPAGVGKTQIARTIANEGKLGFVKATTTELKGKFLGHAAANVKAVFDRARTMAPCILFIDELDIVAPARGGDSQDKLAGEMVGQLLQEMEGIEAHKHPVFVLAATNCPDGVDPAILSRFTERITVQLPGPKERERLLLSLLNNSKVTFDLVPSVGLLVEHSDGFSGRDIKNWITRAQRLAVQRAIDLGGAENYRLEIADFLATAHENAVAS